MSCTPRASWDKVGARDLPDGQIALEKEPFMLILQSRRMRLGAVLLCLGLGLGSSSSATAQPAAAAKPAAAPAKPAGAPGKAKGKGKKAIIGAKSSALSNALNDKG